MRRARTNAWLFAVLLVAAIVGLLVPKASAQPPTPPPAPPATATATATPTPTATATATPTATATATAKKGDITASLPCTSCHTTEAWKSSATESPEGGFDHSKTGFPLTGLHASVACVACHLPNRPTPSRECSSCHEDWHRGRLSSSCDRCHSAASWKVTKPIDIHRFTRFPLTGMHALADCNQCHRRAADHQWSGTPVDCFGCHETEYLRPNLRPPHQGPGVTQPFSRDCSQCHRAIAWAPAFVRITATGVAPQGLSSQPAPANHDLRFPISFGSHRTAACADCHASQSVPQAVRCIGCHAHDPAVLAQRHKQPISTLGSSCLGCHPAGARR